MDPGIRMHKHTPDRGNSVQPESSVSDASDLVGAAAAAAIVVDVVVAVVLLLRSTWKARVLALSWVSDTLTTSGSETLQMTSSCRTL